MSSSGRVSIESGRALGSVPAADAIRSEPTDAGCDMSKSP